MATPSSPKILLVDDTDANRYAMSRLLRKEGFLVIEAASGREALQLAAAQPQPDLIVLDIRLPDLSGFEICAQLKEHPATMATPVLQLSAVYVRDEDKVQGLQSGADSYLTGPVEPPVLLATVRALLRVRQTEVALREREERLRLALDAARMGTWDWDLRTGVMMLSANYEVAAGLGPGAFGGTYEAFLTMVHPSDRPEVDQTVSRALAEGMPYDMEFRLVRPDGTVRWIASKGQVFADTVGQVVRMAGVAMDITTRKQTEEASRWLAAIVESSDDAIISKTLDGVVTSWNAAAERLFGYRTEEMIGQPILRLLPKDRHDEEHMILERLRRGERVDHFETVRRTKDGRAVDVSVTISPIRDEHGSIIGASKIARDITQQKHMERELARRAAELQRVHDELQQFSHIVAHDLNEPLRTMSNFATLLARCYQGQLDATADEYISFVTEAAQRMQQMLTDLLSYTRVGGPTGTFTIVNSEALLTRVQSELQVAIADAKAEVTHDPLPTVLGDATRLEAVEKFVRPTASAKGESC